MRTLLIFSIAIGILNGISFADDKDSLVSPDTTVAQIEWDSFFIPCSPCPIQIEGKCPQPDYPQDAMRDSIEGRAAVQLRVDKTGHVDTCSVVFEKPTGHGFGRAAELAIRRWEFEPAIKDGYSVSMWITLPIDFNLPNKPNKSE